MLIKNLILLLLILFFTSCRQERPDQLDISFKDPPDHTKPWLYWYWIDENISKEGITRDLEAMARVGIGQALIGHVSPGNERGKVRILSEEWWDMVKHAVKEGQRTGVDIGFFNGPGWSQSGGPWIGKDLAMRHVVSSEIRLTGPSIFRDKIDIPDTLFELIALQAIPLQITNANQSDPIIRNTSSYPETPNIENVFDKNLSKPFQFPDYLYHDNNLIIDIDFVRLVNIQSIQFDFLPIPFKVDIEIQTKDKHSKFQTVRAFTLDRRYINFEIGPMRHKPALFSLPKIQSDQIRIKFSNLTASRGAGLNNIEFKSTYFVDQVIEKQLGKMFSGPLPSWSDYLWPDQTEPSSMYIIDVDKIIDLTSKISNDGYLEWEIPDGDWILLLSGMVPTGATNVPVPQEATGFECDKFTNEAIEKHFDAYIGKFLKNTPAGERQSLKTVVIDSYEVGPQNWTNEFQDIFIERYGYDPIPWLPVFSGKVIESADLSNRFLWDVRRLTADLISNVYVKRLRELSNEQGLDLWLENYGHWGFPGEFLQYGGQADKVSGEFWYENHLWDLGPLECRAASSAAHIYGKNQVFAEAFTAGFNFRQYPGIMKSRGDLMFCEGVNHIVQHVYVHQPWEDLKPGVTTWFGMAYQRHNTWFEQSRAWNKYFQRCHYLLQQGLPVSDVCYFIGEDAPKMTGTLTPTLPKGYDFDFINADVIMNNLTVHNGLLTLPDGKTYQLMVLPPQKTMRPEILQQIKNLLSDGACIYGPPPLHSPSMENYPMADQEVQTLSRQLWGNKPAQPVIQNIGKGQLFYGENLNNVFSKLKIEPDVIVPDTSIRWTHRRSDHADVYFISNQEGNEKTIEVSFRISDKAPEFWYPNNGKIIKTALYRKEKNRTQTTLKMDPFGSMFVVFRERISRPFIQQIQKDEQDIFVGRNSPEDPEILYLDEQGIGITTKNNGNYTLTLSDGIQHDITINDIPDPYLFQGPWEVLFPENWDVPSHTFFDQLISWTDHEHEGIKHFSGTASYIKKIQIPEEMLQPDHILVLDLGKVMVMAEVIVNGSNMGILWKKPYEVEITKAIRKGENNIEIRITNTWWNRLVGDEKYPQGFPGSDHQTPRTFTTQKAWSARDGLFTSGLLGPVKIYTKKQLQIQLQE